MENQTNYHAPNQTPNQEQYTGQNRGQYTPPNQGYNPNPNARYDPRVSYDPTYTNYVRSGAQAAVENDPFLYPILLAVRPQLKAPLTAVLCSREEMSCTPDGLGGYLVNGYVSSHNSYGAYISTDFTVTANYQNGRWIISNPKVGVKQAKQMGKSYAFIWLIAIFGTLGLTLFFYLIYSLILF